MKPNNNRMIPLGVGFAIGAITIGAILLVRNHDREPSRYSVPSAGATIPTPSASPVFDPAALSRLTTTMALDPAVTRVAARFTCSCGTCGEKRLDICGCETAQRERAYLQEQLRQGRSEAEAAEALNKKYGGLKL